MADPSNAGPYEIGVSGTLSAGETREYLLSEQSAGPANKFGYLRKVFGSRGGMDYIFVTNQSGEPIAVDSKGGRTPIPPATSLTLDTGPYTSLTVTNEGGSSINTSASDDVTVEVGNGPRQTDGGASFSPVQALEDSIPGLSLGGGR